MYFFDLNINVYILVNRVFENKDCDSFRTLKDNLSFASGIFYEDIAVYQILKDTNINLIWNQAHFVTNSHSINVWLDKVYSVLKEDSDYYLIKDDLNKHNWEYSKLTLSIMIYKMENLLGHVYFIPHSGGSAN